MCNVPEHLQSLPLSSLSFDYYFLIAVVMPTEVVPGAVRFTSDAQHGSLTPIASAESKFFIYNSWEKAHLRSIYLKVKQFHIFRSFFIKTNIS